MLVSVAWIDEPSVTESCIEYNLKQNLPKTKQVLNNETLIMNRLYQPTAFRRLADQVKTTMDMKN